MPDDVGSADDMNGTMLMVCQHLTVSC
ncbi:hypothetical protein C5167_032046 [Papaver somniferum]|uniref:Uncharacterized protein n=1 Tax=Papaver somniferum TaxID=3469 RepID=A0A4Y7K900_PAPSO|nr:hypothetical protein C5167_032046 [Papaver somniferum]